MTIKHLFTSFLLFTILLTSCATLEVGIETTPTTDQAAIETTVAEIVQATVQASETQPTETPSPTIEAMTTNAPTEAPQPEPSSPYAGLIYRLEDQLFRVGPDGQTLSLAPGLDSQYMPGQFTPRAAFSSDGKWMISWWDWEDLWLVDLTTGDVRNLTNTSDREECCAQFWPGRSDSIVFLFRTKGEEGMSPGNMAVVNLDGSDYRLLVDESAAPIGLPALSPDGSTIAYDPAGKPWRYYLDRGPEAFIPADYGLQTSQDYYGLTNPSWSPSGQYFAWMVSGDLNGSGQPQGGAAVFDLQGKTYRHLHPYEPVGMGGGGFQPVVWSPDGNWLAIFEHSVSQPGVWVMHLDGSAETLAYSPAMARAVSGLLVLWSPDSQRLLVSDPNAEGGTRITLYNLPVNQVEASPLPEGAIPLAWMH